jgi:tetratricopeptide (TPR) repeat protein/nucleotide-binding universal stress UspA family protein
MGQAKSDGAPQRLRECIVESHSAYNLPDVIQRNRMRSRWVWQFAGAAALTVFCAFLGAISGRAQASADAGSGDSQDTGAGGSRVLLVLPFDNRTGQPSLEWMREAAAQILSMRFASAGFQPTSSADRAYALDHLGLPQGFQPSRASAIKLAQTLDADSIVVGSYTTDGSGIVAEATLVDVPDLRMLPEVSARGEMKDLIAVFGELAWKLTKQLDPDFNVAEETFAAAGNGIPLTAFEQYIRGITEPDQAERLRHLQNAVKLNPGFGQAWMALGREDYNGKQYQDAAEAFAKVDHNGPDGLEADFYRGLSLMFLGDYPHAETAFADVARVLPLADVVNNEAVAESRQGKDGTSLFIEAAAADPNGADYHFNLAVSLKRAGNLPGALNEMAQCLKLRPNDSEAQSLDEAWKGRPAATTGNADPAADRNVDSLERIVRTFDESAFRQAAAMLDQMNAGRLAALSPRERAQTLCAQARGFLDRGLLLEAERLYNDAVAADGASAQAHAGLAEVRERSGDADAARKEAHTALELGPSADAYYVLAQLDLAAGSLHDADNEIGETLKLDPANRAAQDLMRQIEARLGR